MIVKLTSRLPVVSRCLLLYGVRARSKKVRSCLVKFSGKDLLLKIDILPHDRQADGLSYSFIFLFLAPFVNLVIDTNRHKTFMPTAIVEQGSRPWRRLTV